MRKQNHQVVCVLCKQPITDEQRPSIQLKNGGQLHVECWQKHQNTLRRVN